MHAFHQLPSVVGSEEFQINDPDREVLHILYDSRLTLNGFGGLFFALSGPKSDGHVFIPDLFEKGVNQWIISDKKWVSWLEEKGNQNWIFVDDVLGALQSVAAWHRNQFSIPIMGITGSNGKTIVKEWITQLIGADAFICKSPKSFNSQIGVPVSVWNLSPGHTLGIFEAGISQPGEMEKLEQIIQPDIGIFTNLGSAHEEGFVSITQKLKEKLALFKNTEALILSTDFFEKWENQIHEILPAVEIKTWTWTPVGHHYILQFDNRKYNFQLPFSDAASVENLGNAISGALNFGVLAADIQERLSHLALPEMRLSIKEGPHSITLIDDSYTNDLAGLEAALQFARLQQNQNQKLVVVLSDIEQISLEKNELLKKVKAIFDRFSVSSIITIGSQFAELRFDAGSMHFKTVGEALQTISLEDFKDSVLLVKGARRFGFEHLVKAWQKKIHGTRLEINLDAMVHNLNFYKSQLPAKTGIMAMVKALGYGSGGEEIARILEYHRVDYLAVAYVDEGVKLREVGILLPIMVMNPMPEAMPNLIRYGLEPEIYSFRTLDAWNKATCKLSADTIPPIHLKIDTGMHRLGFIVEELPGLITQLNQNPSFKIASVFSHLAGADDDQLKAYSLKQIEDFEFACSEIEIKTGQTFKKHILNSAGILRYPQATYDLVRLGIGLYGIEVNSWYQNQLQPVSSLKTTISQIKKLEKGQTVGYSRSGILSRDSEIATIAIGYADGFRRAFSNGKAQVKVKQQWVPVVGKVCMDMTMIDVTGLQCDEGDEVIIFEDAKSLLQLSESAETIAYEILTGIGHRIKRIFYRA